MQRRAWEAAKGGNAQTGWLVFGLIQRKEKSRACPRLAQLSSERGHLAVSRCCIPSSSLGLQIAFPSSGGKLEQLGGKEACSPPNVRVVLQDGRPLGLAGVEQV